MKEDYEREREGRDTEEETEREVKEKVRGRGGKKMTRVDDDKVAGGRLEEVEERGGEGWRWRRDGRRERGGREPCKRD